jgi:hypothetical protein
MVYVEVHLERGEVEQIKPLKENKQTVGLGYDFSFDIAC